MNKSTITFADLIGAKNVLDKNWILWKKVNKKWIGKRCVSVKDGFKYVWLEDVLKEETIHKYLCGKSADYNEIFNF